MTPARRSSGASAELAPLRREFLAWAAGSLEDGVDPDELWDDAVFLVAMAGEHTGLTRLSAWTPPLVGALAELLGATGNEETIATLPSVLPLLAFLAETGRWDASADDLDEVGELVMAVLADVAPGATVLAALADVREVDPGAEEEALADLPLLAHARALVAFVGRRRPVTSTGGLRRADLPAAAAAVDAGDHALTSLWDEPRLADVWVAATEAGALAIGRTSASATPRGRELVDGAAAPARAFLQHYLTRVMTSPGEQPWLPSPAPIVAPLLAGALAADREGSPLPATVLDPGSTVPLFGVDGGELAQLLGDGADTAAFAEQVLAPARSLLDRLRADGIVAAGEVLRVQPGLETVVGELLLDLLRSALDEDPDEEVVVEGPPTQRYRLRVDLLHAQPPVWRRVEVDPRLSLGDLHDVVQAAFGWGDIHLHAFTSRRLGGRIVRYSCSELVEPVTGDEVEEHAVRIADVLTATSRSLDYTYDFGDDWEHRITLEAVEPTDGGPLPRCTGGAGAEPEEDSGGSYGWARRAAAANDPSDPEHREVREWLGLARGEQLDLSAFDLGDAQERVADLR